MPAHLAWNAARPATTRVVPGLAPGPPASSAPVMGPSCMQLSVTAGCAPYPAPFCCCSRHTLAVHLSKAQSGHSDDPASHRGLYLVKKPTSGGQCTCMERLQVPAGRQPQLVAALQMR